MWNWLPILLLFFAPSLAFGQSQLDPSSYIQNKYAHESAPVKEAKVMIKGVEYTAFRSSADHLFVPSL